MNNRIKNAGKRLPSRACLFCDNKFEDVGGKRIIAQHTLGTSLFKRYRGGGSSAHPDQSFKLYDDSDLYVVVWGQKDRWTDELINKVIKTYQDGHAPWFCQKCGGKVCPDCGEPMNFADRATLFL